VGMTPRRISTRMISSIVPKGIFNLQKVLERSNYRDAARHRSNSGAHTASLR
jgi:hypothetical protein